MEKSEIKEFFKNTTVFITGATGFVGKTLIEKLLRVTEVKMIYMLIREKKGKTVQERLKKIFDNPLFDVLKTTNPNFQNKIKTVVGECGIPGLGISDSDRAKLIATVNVIFHAAATVNFDENLKTAYDINVEGIRLVIKMAREMKGLKSLVFVSTAYANCIQTSAIQEKVYDYPFDEVVAKLEKITKEDAAASQEKIIGEWPNTYTFTKSLSEIWVQKERNNLPIGIFRPSIITSTYKEPIPGWIDNVYAINGISLGTMTGVLRVFPGRSDAIVDIVPVDMCVSAMIASAKDISESAKTKSDIRVYNYTSRNENPITYNLLKFINLNFGVPTIRAIWAPSGIFIQNRTLASILSFVLQIIPAFFMDMFALMTGNKPQLLSVYMKVIKFGKIVKFFGVRDWEFDNQNVQTMWKKLNRADQELFPFSMSALSWVNFSRTYSLGLRRYILKEDDSTLDKAWKKHDRFQVAHLAVKALAAYVICCLINLIFCKIYNIVFS